MTGYQHLVDPELLEAAQITRETTASFTPMTLSKLARRRALIKEHGLPPLDDVPYNLERITRSGPSAGLPEVPVYVINAKPGRSGPGILHLHGGGFTASSARQGLRLVQALARDLDCPVVSVDYRLAPEARWHESLEDNYCALLWVHEQAHALGIDPQRLAVAGESAGGGHAALLALAARDRGEVPIAFQCLTYPMLDDRSGTSRAIADHIGFYGWNGDANRFGWECFLGCNPGGPAVPAEAVPSRHENLGGLPSTWIAVGALDCVSSQSERGSAGFEDFL